MKKEENKRADEEDRKRSVYPPEKTDLDKYRKELGVPERNTVAVGKTDVKELEKLKFKGASPAVRREAGLPDLDKIAPDRDIKSPSLDVRGTKHAEEGVFHEFDEAVKEANLKPEEVEGTSYIHQSNPRGVCTTCIQGINNPNVEAGIFKQFGEKYPKLTIQATSEGAAGVKPAGKQSFKLLNGKFI